MNTLFDEDHAGDAPREPVGAPLAARVRPRGVRDFVGQEQLLREGASLRTALDRNEPHSMILYGPPGSGKTTLARMFADSPGWVFEEHSAVQVGLAEVRAVRKRARLRREAQDLRTVFFLDEIHRFNKSQQDALLPAVEEGLVTLIGATTENPAFEINGALLSRVRVYALEQLSPADVAAVLRRALASGEASGLPAGLSVDEEAIEHLSSRVEGDARMALNALELAAGDRERARRAAYQRGACGGRAAATRGPLRPRRRPPLRLHIGVDQGDARFRSGRVAVLPRGDARGRRGPALHRPQDGDPGV